MNIKQLAVRALYATLVTGGLTLLGAGVAHAADTSGDEGILSGTQAGLSLELPITVAGNALSVLGDSTAQDASTEVTTDAVAEDAAAPTATTSGDDSILGGTQALIDVSLPITVGGNAISVIGDSTTTDASTTVASDAGDAAGAGAAETSGDDSILGGTQGLIDLDVPVTVGGNAISVIGDSTTTDASTTVASDAGGAPAAGAAETSGLDSILGGTQLLPSLDVPVTIGGNAISVIGDSTTEAPTTVVNPPVVPTEPTDPTDPTEPTDPGDPGDPGDPTVPTVPGGSSTPAGGGVASSPASTTSGVTQLASTGFASNGTWWAFLLLLLGIALLAERNTLPRRRSRR